MPLSPFHFGPGLLIGILLATYVDLLSILVGSVIIDVTHIYYLIIKRTWSHGIHHTYLMGLLWGLGVGLLIFKLLKKKELKKVLIGSVSSTLFFTVTSTRFGLFISNLSTN